MKNNSVKTISIYMIGQKKPKWIFDVSDTTAKKIIDDFNSDLKMLQIDNIPTKFGTKTLYIAKARIEFIENE